MRIIALSTGSVRVKRDMARGRPGPLRRARLFLPGPLGGPRPIHAWVVEHADGLLLVDSGERPGVRDLPFATFDVGPGDDVVSRLRAAGIDPDEIGAIALTHLHGDHMNGVPLLPGRQVLVSAGELRDARGLLGRIEKRVTHQPLPEPFAPTTLTFDGPPIGGFAASQPVTPDGRVIAVPAPGHTPHHVAYLVDEGDHHVLLGRGHDLRPGAAAGPGRRRALAERQGLAGHDRPRPRARARAADGLPAEPRPGIGRAAGAAGAAAAPGLVNVATAR